MAGLGLFLVLGLACQGPTPSDPRALVEQLGSPRYAEREAAEEALRRLGVQAVPALKTARESRDMEIRARAAALLRKIEATVLSEPTMVSLDYRDRTVNEVVRSLSERTGMRLVLAPANPARWDAERITLEEPHPVPFWKAMDRFGSASGLLPDPTQRGPDVRGDHAITLADRRGRPVLPMFDSGPFRISLLGLEYRRHIGFAPERIVIALPNGGGPVPNRPAVPPAPQPVATANFSGQIQLAAEPRLSIAMLGSPVVTEAVDEKGQSLALPTAPQAQALQTAQIESFRQFSRGGISAGFITTSIQLVHPEEPGKTIKVLRGSIPLLVVARQADPLVVPLAGAAGKSFDKGDLHVEIHEIRPGPNDRGRQIELTARTVPSSELVGADPSAAPGSSADLRGPQIEILDGRGQPIPWFRTGLEPEESRFTIGLAGLIAGEAKELRLFRVNESRVTVPFEFRDLPMP